MHFRSAFFDLVFFVGKAKRGGIFKKLFCFFLDVVGILFGSIPAPPPFFYFPVAVVFPVRLEKSPHSRKVR